MNGHKTALFSPGGDRLYVVGVSAAEDSDGNFQFEERWQGLQVINPASGAEIARLEVDSSDLALSKDGSKIILRGWDTTSTWTEVYSADSLNRVSRLKGLYLVPTSKVDGEPILLSNVSNQHQTSLSEVDQTNFVGITGEFGDMPNIGGP
jgi:hypothetical protein